MNSYERENEHDWEDIENEQKGQQKIKSRDFSLNFENAGI